MIPTCDLRYEAADHNERCAIFFPSNNNFALVRPVECCQEIKERGLPRPGGINKDDELAGLNHERDIQKSRDRQPAASIRFRDSLDLNKRKIVHPPSFRSVRATGPRTKIQTVLTTPAKMAANAGNRNGWFSIRSVLRFGDRNDRIPQPQVPTHCFAIDPQLAGYSTLRPSALDQAVNRCLQAHFEDIRHAPLNLFFPGSVEPFCFP
jgi:hypothetical protein